MGKLYVIMPVEVSFDPGGKVCGVRMPTHEEAQVIADIKTIGYQ
jgi:hypothetical protein